MSPGEEIETEKFFFAKSSIVDYEELCSLDVLGPVEKLNVVLVVPSTTSISPSSFFHQRQSTIKYIFLCRSYFRLHSL